jgi:hypothetical protein
MDNVEYVHTEPAQWVCPNCHYCPTCGRSGLHMTSDFPIQPIVPTWPNPIYPFWTTISGTPVKIMATMATEVTPC